MGSARAMVSPTAISQQTSGETSIQSDKNILDTILHLQKQELRMIDPKTRNKQV